MGCGVSFKAKKKWRKVFILDDSATRSQVQRRDREVKYREERRDGEGKYSNLKANQMKNSTSNRDDN